VVGAVAKPPVGPHHNNCLLLPQSARHRICGCELFRSLSKLRSTRYHQPGRPLMRRQISALQLPIHFERSNQAGYDNQFRWSASRQCGGAVGESSRMRRPLGRRVVWPWSSCWRGPLLSWCLDISLACGGAGDWSPLHQHGWRPQRCRLPSATDDIGDDQRCHQRHTPLYSILCRLERWFGGAGAAGGRRSALDHAQPLWSALIELESRNSSELAAAGAAPL